MRKITVNTRVICRLNGCPAMQGLFYKDFVLHIPSWEYGTTTHVEKFLFYSQPCSLFSALKTTLVTIIFQYLPSVLLTISKNKPILLLNSIAIFWSQYQQNKNTFGYTITIFKCMYHIKLYESLYHSLKSTKILITLEALLNSL